MELTLFWTHLAEDKLQDIFRYYKLKVGVKTARKIIIQIISKTDKLERQPRIGAVEELLTDRHQEFRSLVSTNYKIIYYINHETNRIVIANVFDTRQNPKKMQKMES